MTSSLPLSPGRLDTVREETDNLLEYPIAFTMPVKPPKKVSFAADVAAPSTHLYSDKVVSYRSSTFRSTLNNYAAKAMHSKANRLHNALKDDIVDIWEGKSHTINYSSFDLGHWLRADEQWENVSEFSPKELKLLASKYPQFSADWLDFLEVELRMPKSRGQRETAPPSWLPDK